MGQSAIPSPTTHVASHAVRATYSKGGLHAHEHAPVWRQDATKERRRVIKNQHHRILPVQEETKERVYVFLLLPYVT